MVAVVDVRQPPDKFLCESDRGFDSTGILFQYVSSNPTSGSVVSTNVC